MDSATIRTQANEALQKAEEAFQNSEYPRLGKAAYTELSEALKNLAATIEAPPTKPKENNEYEIRKAARIDRLKRRAAQLRVESARLGCRSHDIGRVIPFGQPILVGHHSERGHRNAIDRMHRASQKANELLQAAEQAENSAKAAEKSYAISSDDPRAVEKLKEKLATLERERDAMKEANALIRKGNLEGLKAMGWSEEKIYRLLNPRESYQRKGFQAWEITNLAANIRNVKERIAALSKVIPEEAKIHETRNGFEAFENAEDNRICFRFDGKPSDAIRGELKSHGFKWSPSRGLWIRQITVAARYAARQVIVSLKGN